ncbi:MAG: HlyD family efflux transporter periplasmic adaptor subunit [Planctomycetales bacterium]|nr:HlyD family efflux transporter periplasmic adaptor subunit [Planctomycetales bacterium]
MTAGRAHLHGPSSNSSLPRVTRRERRGATAAIVVTLLLLLSGGGAGVYYYFSQRDANELKEPPLTHVVNRGKFDHIVLEQGEIESSSNVEVMCEVKSRNSGTAILWVVEEGTHVKEGDLLVELDSSVLEQELTQQKIAESNGEARVITATSALEQANVAKDEYLDGTFKQEEKTIESEILVAEEALSRAQETAKYSEVLAAQQFITPQQLRADQFAVKQREVELKLAEQKLKTLQEITKRKMLIQLEADIKAAEAQLKAEQESFNEEVAKRKEVEEQIAKCKITAPQAGQVVHANKTSSRGNAEFVVEPGAMVRERQTIIRLPDPDQMRVTSKINEARVPLVEPEMPVTIEIGAINNTLEGRVTKVNKYAEPTSFFGTQTKEYLTYIEVLNPPENIRSGMTAEVKIYVAQLPDVLQVPVQAVVEEKGHYFSIVTHGGSNFETRQVKVGASNDKFLVVEDGVKEGETVVLNPRMYRDRMDIPKDLAPVTPKVVPGNGKSKGKGKGKGKGGDVAGGGPGGPGGAGGDGPPSPAAIVGRIMDGADTNGDGKLEQGEIDAMDERGRAMAGGADANSDGVVDRGELMAAVAKRMAERRASGGGPGGPGGGPGGPGGPGGGRE